MMITEHNKNLIHHVFIVRPCLRVEIVPYGAVISSYGGGAI
jgi:hypothetical protein